MSWRIEFPTLNVPKAIDDLVESGDLSDDSWHNDICGSFSAQMKNGLRMIIWITYEKPEERETPDMSRFAIGAQVGETVSEHDVTFFHSEDLRDVLAMIYLLLKRNGGN